MFDYSGFRPMDRVFKMLHGPTWESNGRDGTLRVPLCLYIAAWWDLQKERSRTNETPVGAVPVGGYQLWGLVVLPYV